MVLAAPLPHPPAVVRRSPAPKVPLPLKIARQATAFVGARNARFYRPNPREACASFVSAVLVKAGAISRATASASARILANRLVKRGWKKVGARMSRSRTAVASRPGDVIVWGCGPISHVTIAGVARGTMIGTSSSRGRVMRWSIRTWPSQACAALLRHAERR